MIKLPRHSPCLKPDDLAMLVRTVFSAPDRTLDHAFGAYLRGRRLIPAPSGRHALWLYLEHSGLGPGDEVLVAAYNFYGVVQLLAQWGLVPRFVDVDPETLCMDPAALAAAVTPRSRLVLVTHMFGHPAPMEAIAALCREHGLALFEDCAHAVGTLCGDGAPAGMFGHGALFSFGIFKVINCYGGGMLVVPPGQGPSPDGAPYFDNPGGWAGLSDPLMRLVTSLLLGPGLNTVLLDPLLRASPALYRKVHPSAPNPDYRFDVADRPLHRGLLGALATRQMRGLEAGVARRREIVARVHAGIAGLERVRPLSPDLHGRSNGSYLGLRADYPVAAAACLAARGVDSAPREFVDCSALPQFARFSSAGSCPGARLVHRHTLRVPSFPCLSDGQVDRIIEGLAAC